MNGPQGLLWEKAIFDACKHLGEIHSGIREPQGSVLETEVTREAGVLSESVTS